ncbi:hypothetical protein [Riemerella columbipharyngis]|uniref:Helix-turn-helix domain-containing protein n=1 Tax=Riemerella columbipharyngis TaxID=1071918 RepID=A0A1G7ALJ7_9FLAO|nr:hypothetical protein [Riemerella columbipharyngis]SDE15590.1 hypothetical protein SAMN05421544_10419 [Riemerella columbipharyngis]
MTTIEMMESAYLIEVSKKITMTLQEFCQVTGWDKRKVYQRIKNKILPEQLIKGGYEYRSQRKQPIFLTKEVLDWIKN